jgi:hypothetical protein
MDILLFYTCMIMHPCKEIVKEFEMFYESYWTKTKPSLRCKRGMRDRIMNIEQGWIQYGQNDPKKT